MINDNDIFDAKLRDQYRDLQMMKSVMEGKAIKFVAAATGISPRTCRRRVNIMAGEMMRRVMEQTQGDPDHPAEVRYTVEEFTANPRGCLVSIMQDTIREIERQFPDLSK